MFVGYVKDMKKVDMTPAGAVKAVKQIAVGAEQGWEDYVMRIMTVEPGGNTPKHAHDWPHINYVISGEGVLMIDGQEFGIHDGACAYVPANDPHSFTNIGEQPLQFICIVPTRGES